MEKILKKRPSSLTLVEQKKYYHNLLIRNIFKYENEFEQKNLIDIISDYSLTSGNENQIKIFPSSLSLLGQKEFYKLVLLLLKEIYFDINDVAEIIADYSVTADPNSCYVKEFFDRVETQKLIKKELDHFLIDIDINIKNKNGKTVLHTSKGNKHKRENFSLLLSHGFNVNNRDNVGNTLLIEACSSSNYTHYKDIILFLLSYEADPNIQDKNGYTALVWACFFQKRNCISLLLSNGANPNIIDYNGSTILIELIKKRFDTAQIISQLLSNGANPNLRDKNGSTPLIEFCKTKYKTETISILLSFGANPNLKDKDGNTALMEACKWKFKTQIISLLLLNGANPDLRNKNGSTAMMIAYNKGNNDIISLLLLNGANPDINDDNLYSF